MKLLGEVLTTLITLSTNVFTSLSDCLYFYKAMNLISVEPYSIGIGYILGLPLQRNLSIYKQGTSFRSMNVSDMICQDRFATEFGDVKHWARANYRWLVLVRKL